MQSLLMCNNYIWFFLLLIFHTGTQKHVESAKVTDLTPRVLTRNTLVPKLNGLASSNRYYKKLKREASSLWNKGAETPIATTILGSSLLLSSTVWTGMIAPESLLCVGFPKKIRDLHRPLTSVLLMPELNGTTLLNLVSFYTLLKQAEETDGRYNLLKRTSTNLLTSTLIAGLFNETSDFHKFSRAVTVTNALEHPEQPVNFQGIISLKQWHLPLALLIADYLMTLRVEQAIEGSKATLAGVITHLICNRT